MNLDQIINPLDRALRTVFSRATSARPLPGASFQDVQLSEHDREMVAGLMRINHTGEICAQALYDGQLAGARDARVRVLLVRAAKEETEHLAWTEQRLEELGSRKSVLNPLFYAGSFAMGAVAGMIGDRWSLGFLSETERQVEQHLTSHLDKLPPEDERSRAIIEQMRADEVEHALAAQREGGAALPLPIRVAMRAAAKVMTTTTRWL